MIASVAGKISHTTARSIVITTGGIGYEVFTVPRLLEQVKTDEDIILYTHLYVREELMELYGFSNREEVDFFRMLISVSGVGPKSALTIMSLTTLDELKKGIAHGDASLLTKVSGIGKKTAERLILELKSKISDSIGEQLEAQQATGDSDAIDALVNLGYPVSEARDALRQVDTDTTDVAQRIRAALKLLGK